MILLYAHGYKRISYISLVAEATAQRIAFSFYPYLDIARLLSTSVFSFSPFRQVCELFFRHS